MSRTTQIRDYKSYNRQKVMEVRVDEADRKMLAKIKEICRNGHNAEIKLNTSDSKWTIYEVNKRKTVV